MKRGAEVFASVICYGRQVPFLIPFQAKRFLLFLFQIPFFDCNSRRAIISIHKLFSVLFFFLPFGTVLSFFFWRRDREQQKTVRKFVHFEGNYVTRLLAFLIWFLFSSLSLLFLLLLPVKFHCFPVRVNGKDKKISSTR